MSVLFVRSSERASLSAFGITRPEFSTLTMRIQQSTRSPRDTWPVRNNLGPAATRCERRQAIVADPTRAQGNVASGCCSCARH